MEMTLHQNSSGLGLQPAERATVAALLWHFEDDDVKKENATLRQKVLELSAELSSVREEHTSLQMQQRSDADSLRVTQESLRYERRVNTELEGMHRLATENLGKLRDEVRAVYEENTLSAMRATQSRMEGALLGMGWKRAENETLELVKLRRALIANSDTLQELQRQNSELKMHVTLLEFIWTQPLDFPAADSQDVAMAGIQDMLAAWAPDGEVSAAGVAFSHAQ